MCGISGQVGRDPRTIQRRYAAYCAMQQTLARRGPDQRGMYICGAAALIHARLAVVDLENGLQPMQLDWQGETYVLVYNGELYNTPELRAAHRGTAPRFCRVGRKLRAQVQRYFCVCCLAAERRYAVFGA